MPCGTLLSRAVRILDRSTSGKPPFSSRRHDASPAHRRLSLRDFLPSAYAPTAIARAITMPTLSLSSFYSIREGDAVCFRGRASPLSAVAHLPSAAIAEKSLAKRPWYRSFPAPPPCRWQQPPRAGQPVRARADSVPLPESSARKPASRWEPCSLDTIIERWPRLS